jgi:predicted 3-demethylubiquinone-9 3-methyltransferase (glyoxalase superfamily)/DNA-binding transcriptional ArsR family regulator
MSRASTTSDVFNAIAEAHRREILSALGPGELPVGQLCERVHLTQPQVSKHLQVLRSVGLVRCRHQGRHRYYRVNAPALEPLREWVTTFEQMWNERFDRLEELLTTLPLTQPPDDRQPIMTTITPFLWFDGHLDDAVSSYRSIFADFELLESSRYPQAIPAMGGQLMSATVSMAGTRVILFNGGPTYSLNPAFSLMVVVDDQAELDRVWDALCEGGAPSRCGWLTDRFGVSWQVIPRQFGELMGSPTPGVAGRVTEAMLQMVKLDIATLEAAAQAPTN